MKELDHKWKKVLLGLKIGAIVLPLGLLAAVWYHLGSLLKVMVG